VSPRSASVSAPVELYRVGVVGATGALGSELVTVLEERAFPAGALMPIASDRSLGREVEFGGESRPVETEVRSLEGLDLVFLCAPPDVSLGYARLALQSQVPCIDLSGALADQPDVPLLVAERLDPDVEITQPLVAAPPGPALGFALLLAPIETAVGLRRVIATTLEAASVGGRGGVDALSDQSIALFNLQDPDEEEEIEARVAFDCLPGIGELEADGCTRHEQVLARVLARLLGRDVPLALTSVRVPTFGGDGISLVIETERPLDVAGAQALLEKAPGVRVWPADGGPSTRTTVGREAVLAGRIRRDPSGAGLQLWAAMDGLRLAALNGVRLAEALRLRRRRA
jgi:aspartate-semialdehyde dehydrogenase